MNLNLKLIRYTLETRSINLHVCYVNLYNFLERVSGALISVVWRTTMCVSAGLLILLTVNAVSDCTLHIHCCASVPHSLSLLVAHYLHH